MLKIDLIRPYDGGALTRLNNHLEQYIESVYDFQTTWGALVDILRIPDLTEVFAANTYYADKNPEQSYTRLSLYSFVSDPEKISITPINDRVVNCCFVRPEIIFERSQVLRTSNIDTYVSNELKACEPCKPEIIFVANIN